VSLARPQPRSTTFILLALVALLMTLLPSAALGADGRGREYIVTLDVPGSGRIIRADSRAARRDVRQRAARADEATTRVARTHGLAVSHRFGHALTGFSAVMTPAQAAALGRDAAVSSVRAARTFGVAAQIVPPGIERVEARDSSTTPGPDVDVDVAVIDTGIGPGDGFANPIAMDAVAPQGKPELDLAGGVNCYDDPDTTIDESVQYPGRYADTLGHGTHVAGIIGARDNAVGTVGVAPGARLWSVRVFQGYDGSEASIVCGLDWVIATHSNAIPDIDVVNMSIQGPRLDYQEDCPTIVADPGADPIQQAICTATAMGIVVVAAAGNSASNANDTAPGGFDQVISVAAMTDTDGRGGGQGPNAGCSGYRDQADDTWASYSNYGPDVDIVAPGTCIVSTARNRSGAATATLTGTSMAAPHVTGAVARYVAEHGSGGNVAQIRGLVRAAGRLDWAIRSDPVWSGVDDPDPPDRVLDVAALNGAPMIRIWMSDSRLVASGTETASATRVDVQRGGGYAGGVALGLAGLPATVGRADFDSASLSGLGPQKLGTTLRLALRRSGPDGLFPLVVQGTAGGVPSASRALRLTVDRTGPRADSLDVRLRAGRAPLTWHGAAQVRVRWSVSDALSRVRSVKLQRKPGTRAWRFAGVAGASSSRVTLKRDQVNRFRLKSTDSLGNRRTSYSIGAHLYVRDDRSVLWRRLAGDGWTTKSVRKAYGGSILVARGAASHLVTRVSGQSVGIVSSIGPRRGRFRVRVDDGPWSTVRLTAGKGSHRRVVWSRSLTSGTHRLEIDPLSGQTTIDALLIVH
jgi:subtilisin